VVARASWPDEVVLRCMLGELADRVHAEGIRRTAIIVVGEVLAHGSFQESHLYSAGRDRHSAGRDRGAGNGREDARP
jgi:precorrin-4/cobalt-precorrin-4 C11-methyltransferase